ncbi:MAG: hypothetical protein KC609_26695 [Myxococcales bacterium]|nr:hypothetical protein [Myxococcales bacterium]
MALRYDPTLFVVPEGDRKLLAGLIGDRRPWPFYREMRHAPMFAEEAKERTGNILLRHTTTFAFARLKLEWDETVEAVEWLEGPRCLTLIDYDRPVPSDWQREQLEGRLIAGAPRVAALAPLRFASWWASDDETRRHYYVLAQPPAVLLVETDAEDRIESFDVLDHQEGGERLDALWTLHHDAGSARPSAPRDA